MGPGSASGLLWWQLLDPPIQGLEVVGLRRAGRPGLQRTTSIEGTACDSCLGDRVAAAAAGAATERSAMARPFSRPRYRAAGDGWHLAGCSGAVMHCCFGRRWGQPCAAQHWGGSVWVVSLIRGIEGLAPAGAVALCGCDGLAAAPAQRRPLAFGAATRHGGGCVALAHATALVQPHPVVAVCAALCSGPGTTVASGKPKAVTWLWLLLGLALCHRPMTPELRAVVLPASGALLAGGWGLRPAVLQSSSGRRHGGLVVAGVAAALQRAAVALGAE